MQVFYTDGILVLILITFVRNTCPTAGHVSVISFHESVFHQESEATPHWWRITSQPLRNELRSKSLLLYFFLSKIKMFLNFCTFLKHLNFSLILFCILSYNKGRAYLHVDIPAPDNVITFLHLTFFIHFTIPSKFTSSKTFSTGDGGS